VARQPKKMKSSPAIRNLQTAMTTADPIQTFRHPCGGVQEERKHRHRIRPHPSGSCRLYFAVIYPNKIFRIFQNITNIFQHI
jgi:hypothetical protein